MYFIRRDRHEHPLKIVSLSSRHVPVRWEGLVAIEHATHEFATGTWHNERFEFDASQARAEGAAPCGPSHMAPHEMPGCFVFHREDAAD